MSNHKWPAPTPVTGARRTPPRKTCKGSTCMWPRNDSSTARPGRYCLQDAKTNRRTGFWLHQRGARISPVQLPRVRECAQRVETDLCHAQSVEAFPVRLENAAFEKLTVSKTRSRSTPQQRIKTVRSRIWLTKPLPQQSQHACR
jgi:hypothetical protein